MSVAENISTSPISASESIYQMDVVNEQSSTVVGASPSMYVIDRSDQFLQPPFVDPTYGWKSISTKYISSTCGLPNCPLDSHLNGITDTVECAVCAELVPRTALMVGCSQCGSAQPSVCVMCWLRMIRWSEGGPIGRLCCGLPFELPLVTHLRLLAELHGFYYPRFDADEVVDYPRSSSMSSTNQHDHSDITDLSALTIDEESTYQSEPIYIELSTLTNQSDQSGSAVVGSSVVAVDWSTNERERSDSVNRQAYATQPAFAMRPPFAASPAFAMRPPFPMQPQTAYRGVHPRVPQTAYRGAHPSVDRQSTIQNAASVSVEQSAVSGDQESTNQRDRSDVDSQSAVVSWAPSASSSSSLMYTLVGADVDDDK